MPPTAFDTPAGPVACTGITPALLGYFRTQAPHWPETGSSDLIGEVSVLPDSGGWRFSSSCYEAPDFRFDDGLGAGNGLIGCLIHTFVAASGDWIAFHAGAVETDSGLTVLAGDMMAGKSTLTAALVAQGHRLWCDDRLPVYGSGGAFEGMSLALRPKLRRPLAPNAPDWFKAFFEARAGEREGGMQYLVPKYGEAAGFDERLSLRRIVLLERNDAHGKLEETPLPLGQAVKRLSGCTFAPHLGPVGLLERLRAIVENCDCTLLSYSDSFEAARYAHAAWGTGR